MMWDGYGHGGGLGALWLIVYIIIVAIPIARILRRIGYSPWWTIVALIPLVNLVFLWIVAFADWPLEKSRGMNAGGTQ